MSKSKQIALSGMIAALQIVLLLLGGVMWIFCYASPMFCGLIIIILNESAGKKYSLLAYVVCSIIAILFVPDKECALTYIFFFGYYPIIRDCFDKLPKALSVVLKFMLFNISIAASQLLLVFAFRIPFDNSFGRWTIPMLVLSFNFVFVFYEKLLPRFAKLYHIKYKSRVDRLLR